MPTRYATPGQIFTVVVPQSPATLDVWQFTPKCHLKILADDTEAVTDNTGTVTTTFRVLQVRLSKKASKCDHPYIDGRLINTTTGTIVSTSRLEVKVKC